MKNTTQESSSVTATLPKTGFESLFLVERDSEEWHWMWAKLAEKPCNKSLPDPTAAMNFGECWQYMESAIRKSWLLRRRYVVHLFRHRCHPTGKGRHSLSIKASPEFSLRYRDSD